MTMVVANISALLHNTFTRKQQRMLMQSLSNELTKYRKFVSEVRHLNIVKPQELVMTSSTQNSTVTNSRSTGGQSANKRYKRTPEELEADIAKVDELVASGKFNQIEALNHVGLQSSVYHYKKRQIKEPFAKSLKPRKFSNRPNRSSTTAELDARKNEVLNAVRNRGASNSPIKTKASASVSSDTSSTNSEVEILKQKIKELEIKFSVLMDIVARK